MKTSLLTSIFILLTAVVAVAQPTVTGSTPSRNSVNQTATTNINIAFSESMDAATLNETTVFVTGSYRGAYTGVFSMSNASTMVFNPDVDFLPGEVISTTVTTGAQNSASNTPMARSFSFSFTVAATGYGLFTDANAITVTAGNFLTDIVTADFNGDGHIDFATISQGINTLSVVLNNGNGTYAAPVTYATLSPAMSLVTGDFNGDGFPDLAVSNAAASSLSIFLNDEEGGFLTKVDYGTPSSLAASEMVVADMDGDGNLDIVQLHQAGLYLFTYPGNGDGTFDTATQYAITELTQGGSLAVGDYSRDWRPDIVVSDYASDNMRLYENDGAGGFFAGGSVAVGDGPLALTLVSLEGNGYLDAAIGNTLGNSLTIRTRTTDFLTPLYNNRGNFATGNYPYSVVGGDLDGDGDLDLIVSNNESASVSIVRNRITDSSPIFQNNELNLGSNPNKAVVADINGDGRLDILTANNNGTVSILYNFAGPMVESVTPANGAIDQSPSAEILITFDSDVDDATLNGDAVRVSGSLSGEVAGVLTYDSGSYTATFNPTNDFEYGETVTIVVATSIQNGNGVPLQRGYTFSYSLSVVNGSGALVDGGSYAVGTDPIDLLLLDINNDGYLDAITANTAADSVAVRLGTEFGTFDAPTNYYAGTAPASIAIGDVTGDGDLDLVVVGGESNISILSGIGDGTFDARTTTAISGNATHVALVDREMDGDLDVFYVVSGQARSMVNNGSGTFSDEFGYNSASTNLVSADVYNNGYPEVIYANTSNQVVVSRYTGSFWTSSSYATGNEPVAVAVGDFNGDGHIDVVTANLGFGAANVSFLANNGSGGLNGAINTSLGANTAPRGITTLDFDADGDLDLAVTLSATDEVAILLNNGTGTFTLYDTFTTGDNPWGIAAADMDDDGQMDVITANRNSDNVTVLLNSTELAMVSYAPAPFDAGVAADADIEFVFNQTIDPDAVEIMVRGSISGVVAGAWSFDVPTSTASFNPTNDFIIGETVTVIVDQSGFEASNGTALSGLLSWSFSVGSTEGRSLFLASSSIPVSGMNPADIAIGDIDGDGIPDMVVEKNEAFEVFLGDGMGGFDSQGTVSLDVSPFDVDLADFNGDGNLDVILTAQELVNYVNSQYIFFGDGLGGFSTTADVTITDVSTAQNSYRNIVDVDLDGDLDLIIGSPFPKVYINDGNAGFTLQQTITLASPSFAYMTGDVNGDGYPDLIMTRYFDSMVQVSLNNGSGTFGTPGTVWTGTIEPNSVDVADLDQDGDLDIAIVVEDGTIRVLDNDGTGAFTEIQSLSSTTYFFDPSVDINGDGYPDAIIRSYGAFSIVLNDNGSLEPESVVYTSHDVKRIGLVDIDGDGMVELLMGNSSSSTVDIYKQQDNVEVVSASPLNAALDQANNPTITITFDVPMDGATFTTSNASVVGSLSGAIAGSFNVVGSTATFTPSGTFLPGELVNLSLTTGLKAASGDRLVNPFTSTFTVAAGGFGSLVFDANALSSVGASVSQMAAGDIDGDGEVDLVTYTYGSPGTIRIMTNTAGAFTESSTISITGEVIKIQSVDADLDGDLDLFVVRKFNNDTYGVFFLNDGTGGFPADLSGGFSTPLNDYDSFSGSYQAADFNGDGLIDVAMRGSSNGQLLVSYQTSGFEFGSFQDVAYSESVESGGIADMNNDGFLDFVNTVSGDLGAFVTLGGPSGSFEDGSVKTGTFYGNYSAVGDVNGDGYPDFVLAGDNYDGDNYGFEVYLNDGDGGLSNPVVYALGGDREIYGLHLADIDGDGDLDVWVKIAGYEDENDNYEWKEPVLVAYNNGSGGFGNQLEFFIPYEDPDWFYDFNNMTIADFDGDGRLDAAGIITGNRIALMKNESTGIAGAPSTAATNAGSTGVAYNGATLTWTNGDGDRRIVLVKEGSAVDASPANDGNYQPSGAFGTGSEIGTGNFVVYGGVGSSVTLSGLDAETTYHFAVYETNGIPGEELVLTTDPAIASFTTTAAPVIFALSGSTVTFTKDDYADWTLEENQDRITDYHWITRADDEGLFNMATETSFSGSISPEGTLWAFGTADDISSLTFTEWRDAVDSNPPSMVDETMVIYLPIDNVYIEIEFSSWTENGEGGGFSYTRGSGTIPPRPVPDFDTVAGNALSFDGVDDYSEFSIQSSEGGGDDGQLFGKAVVGFEPTMGAASTYTGNEVPRSFTAEMWVKVSDPEVDAAVFARAEEGAINNDSSRPYSIRVKEGAFSFQFYDYNGDQFVDGSTQIVADTWYHVAATVSYLDDDGDDIYTLRLYVNGREEGTSIDVNNRVSSTSRSYYLGYDGATYFDGEIDEFRFWSKALTSSEIRTYQFRTYDQYGIGLIGYWQFNESGGSTASEIKHEIDMELYGSPAFVTSTVPVGQGTTASVSDFSSGTQTIGNAAITIQGTTGEPLEVTVTELETEPNLFPEGYTTSFGGKVFVIDVFGDLGEATADITLNFGEGVVTSEQEANPSILKLFKRESTSTGAWTDLGGASAADASTGDVTWTGITSFSQFMAAEFQAPPILGIATLNVTTFYENVYTFDSGNFDIDAFFGDSTFVLTLEEAVGGATLFVDVNDDGDYDSGTDLLVNESTGVDYTPADLDVLRLLADEYGVLTASIIFTSGEYADTLAVTFTTVESTPTLSGVADEGGWYLLSNPLDTPLGTLFSSIWTQGAIGSNAPSADATLYTFSAQTTGYSAVTTDLDTTKVRAGQGVLAYIFAFDDLETGVPEGGGWPKTLSNEGNPFTSNAASVAVLNEDSDAVEGTSGSEGFNLFGNPYGWPLSADSLIATLKRADPLANSYVYRWNQAHQTWQLKTSGAIEAYESVFIRAITSGIDTELDFTYDDRYVAAPPKEVTSPLFALTLTHTETGLESAFSLRFDEKASEGIDPFDGYYLGTYARTFANLFAQVDDQSLVINNLPAGLDREIVVPVHLHASLSGEFDLAWDQYTIPAGWSFSIEEVATGTVTNLAEAGSLRFNSERLAKADANRNEVFTMNSADEPVLILRARGPGYTTDIDDFSSLPTEVELGQNYPNPFNPSTQIRYGVPSQSNVKLEVFDVLGRRVTVLVNNELTQPGRYTVAFDASRLSSGVYVYRLIVGDKVMTKRMVLIK